MHTFTVQRSTWLRGEPMGNYLRRSGDEKQCCLGFLARSLGYSEEDIIDIRSPADLDEIDKFPGFCRNPVYDTCMGINDDTEMDDPKREQKLTESLKELDIHVTFVD